MSTEFLKKQVILRKELKKLKKYIIKWKERHYERARIQNRKYKII